MVENMGAHGAFVEGPDLVSQVLDLRRCLIIIDP